MIKDFFNQRNIKIEDSELINLYSKHGIFYSDLDRCELFLNEIDSIDDLLINFVKNIRNLLVSKKELIQYKNELEKYKIVVSFENIKNIKTFKDKSIVDKLNNEFQNNNFEYIY